MKAGHDEKMRTENVLSYHSLTDTEIVANYHLLMETVIVVRYHHLLMETEIVVGYCHFMTLVKIEAWNCCQKTQDKALNGYHGFLLLFSHRPGSSEKRNLCHRL